MFGIVMSCSFFRHECLDSRHVFFLPHPADPLGFRYSDLGEEMPNDLKEAMTTILKAVKDLPQR
jgi:hypothetical protein